VTDRGDIAVVWRRVRMATRDARMYPGVGSTGNVVTSSGAGVGGAEANARVSLQDATGMSVDAATADGSGVWTFYDVAPGTWYARQVSSKGRVWQITVASDLSYTIARLSPGSVAYGG
jgi:hypothetical protein